MPGQGPPPPPPPPPGHPGGRPGGQAMTQQQQQHFQQQQLQQQQQQRAMMQQYTPLVPAQHSGPLVQTLDLRNTRTITKEKARDALSTLTVARFENDDTPSAEDGYESDIEKLPGWVRVKRTWVPGFTKREVARQVRRLNEYTGSVSDKKKVLSSSLNEHLERTGVEIQQLHNQQFWETNLVQLDYQVHIKRDRHRDHRRGSKHNHVARLFHGDTKDWRSHDRRHKHRSKAKVTVDRSSVTAYYKTSPLPDVDAVALWYQVQAHNQRALQPVQPEMGHHDQHQARPMPPPHDNSQQRPPQPVRNPERTENPQRGRSATRNPNNCNATQSNNRQHTRDPSQHARFQSPHHSSPRSMPSRTFSEDADASSSASSASRDGMEDRPNSRVRRPPNRRGGVHEQAHFGIGAERAPPHLQRRFSQHQIDDPVGGVLPFDIERATSNAYAAGRADERREKWDLADDVAAAVASSIQRQRAPRLQPRAIRERSHSPPMLGLEGPMRYVRLVDDEYADDWLDEDRGRVLLPLRNRRGLDFRDDVDSRRRPYEGPDELERQRLRREDEDRTRERIFRARRREAVERELLEARMEHERPNREGMRARSFERRRSQERPDLYVDGDSNLGVAHSRHPFAPRPPSRSRDRRPGVQRAGQGYRSDEFFD